MEEITEQEICEHLLNLSYRDKLDFVSRNKNIFTFRVFGDRIVFEFCDVSAIFYTYEVMNYNGYTRAG